MKKEFRIVLIEDEAATARHLAHLITTVDDAAHIVITLPSIREALVWLKENNDYNLIFSDIQLTDGLAFSIFKELQITKPVIFVTAHNDYAIQAFRTNGIDYILKPFDEEDITRAFIKYDTLIYQPQNISESLKMASLITQLETATKHYKKSFLIHFRGQLIPVESAKINWFYTAHEIVYAHTFDGQQYTVESTLEQLEKQLDPAQFFRANRQFLINRNAIEIVDFFFNGRLLVTITPPSKEQLLVSKARATLFRKWLDK